MDALQVRQAWAKFCALDKGHALISQLSDASQQKQLRRDETLINQGDAVDGVYLVVAGQLRAVRYTANGHEIWLSDLFGGDLVGEIAVLADTKRTSALLASRPTSLLSIATHTFVAAILDHGVFGLALAKQFSKRLEATSGQLADLMGMPVDVRLHAELVRAGQQDSSDDEMFVITSVPKVSALGQRIHASREATSRALSSLEKRGLVERTSDHWAVICPRDMLSDLALT
ncbi:MAG: Crp/Fnr family transcriptional regulator [Pseudomonadota bacterium]